MLGVLILPFKDHSSSNPPLDLTSPWASFTHSQSPPLTTPLSQPHSRSLTAFGAPTVVCSTPQRLNAFALKHSLASPSTAVTAHSDSEPFLTIQGLNSGLSMEMEFRLIASLLGFNMPPWTQQFHQGKDGCRITAIPSSSMLFFF
ncbi:hypothetical protein C1H46_000349 [Malus baccata]|uniref:Uncharacterized protein n=1 Tax=Malus baccata TaxID=106549 RepID=A0A540NSX4_MALBA|nr:hypothetical protein C1H46_000349 [Malus baccata]